MVGSCCRPEGAIHEATGIHHVGASAWPLVARAQQASTAKIGLLWPGAGPPVSPRMESFREGLRGSGYVEGQNVTIELRYTEAGQEQLAGHAADLVRANVDVIATFGDGGTKIAQQATRTIPIVTIGDDLLGSGLIGSLSQPGNNTTGITILGPELSAKRLELLSTMVPGLSSVAALWDPISGPSQVAMSENAARTMKLKLQILELAHRDDLDSAFRAARDGHAQAVNVFSSPFLASLYREIIDRAAAYRLPAIYQWREHVEAGGLMSYGPLRAQDPMLSLSATTRFLTAGVSNWFNSRRAMRSQRRTARATLPKPAGL